MTADRFEIIDDGHLTIAIRHGANTLYIDELEDEFAVAAIRQQARDISQLRAECDLLTHKVICCGVAAWHPDPLLTTTGAYAGKWNSQQADCVRKLRAERDQLRADLATVVAERDDYRDEFSGLCHTLSVGSEGRPEMTAADWRKRVDQGIDFLTRPLLSRIEATDKELAKRSNMLDICTQNCSDWIGKWKAEQDRAEQAEARLAAIESAPVVASVGHGDYLHRHTANVPVGTLLIARPAKDQT